MKNLSAPKHTMKKSDDYLECPCCGDVGAEPDKYVNGVGYYQDGQPLICGCTGMVSVDEEDGAYISIDICECYLKEA